MRDHYTEALKELFHNELYRIRVNVLNITQEEMAQLLAMSCRSYVDLEHSKTSCGALTLALFLVYACENPTAFLNELREEFEKVKTSSLTTVN